MYAKLLDLPAELLESIFALLEKKSLKALRRSCKELNATTSWLFRSFTLYPHLHSFDTLSAISAYSKIADHVKILEYETSYWCLPRLRSSHFQGPRKEVIASLQKINADTLVGGNPSDELTQMDYLQQSIPKLLNLQAIKIYGVPSALELPEFYKKRLPEKASWSGRASVKLKEAIADEPEPKQTYALMLLAGARTLTNLQSLTITGIQWDDFLGHTGLFDRPLLYRQALSELKHLDLRSADDYSEHLWDGDVVLNLQTMLQLCTSLESLVLHLRYPLEILVGGESAWDYTHDEHCQSIFQHEFEEERFNTSSPKSIAQLSWSTHLRSFESRGLVITFTELISVLTHMASSLRVLNLSDLILIPEPRRSPRPCLVRLFRWLRKGLQLDHIGLEGTWCNSGRQNITFTKSNNTKCLRNQLQEYIVSKSATHRQCPLGFLTIEEGYFDYGSRTYSDSIPQILMNHMSSSNYDTRGDESVAIKYEVFVDIPSDEEDDEEETDSNDDNSDTYSIESGENTNDEWESATDDDE